MGTTLMVLGVIIAAVGGILILMAAFRESVGWGLAVLLTCGVGALIFVISHWEEAKKGFLIAVAGNVLQCIGVVMIPPAERLAFLQRLGPGLTAAGTMVQSPAAPGLPARAAKGAIARPADVEVPEQASVTKVALPLRSSGNTMVSSPAGAGVASAPATPVKMVIDDRRTDLLQSNYVGKSIEAVKRILGKPRMEMKVGQRVTISYTDIELISEDGRTIARQYVVSP